MPLHHCPPANISRQAFNAVVGDALFSDASGIYTPRSLQDIALTFLPPGDLEEMANGVVHPKTNETMTKYAKIIAMPELREVWLEAICKELG